MGIGYGDYLRLDTLLDLQHPESARRGSPARDELLFIIIHQTYELWFKQILHELDLIQARFGATMVDDAEIAPIVHSLDRIVAIQRTLVAQVDILETMTPLDFLEFRDLLVPASGFQSLQFRLIEIRLGLRSEDRLSFDGKPFEHKLEPHQREIVARVQQQPSLLVQLDVWLSRTPFLEMGSYDFRSAYRAAVATMFANEHRLLAGNPHLDAGQLERQNTSLQQLERNFDQLFDVASAASTSSRLTQSALIAALFINLYRDEPALQLPFRLLRALMDIDELLCSWRHRHAQMVERMIGRKLGTGGSSGHDYLRATAEKHRVFGDLFALSSFLIPRTALPALPEEVRRAMRYRYAPAGSAPV